MRSNEPKMIIIRCP